jgi:hypothetical protein
MLVQNLEQKMPWKKMEMVSTNHENIMVFGKKKIPLDS